MKLTSIRARKFGEKKVVREQKGGFFKKIFRR
ncbi:AN1-type Zinc finger protein (fragment) [Candidatus Nitrosotenuis uzonensis]|uniref:AN1-type Zinc finger protein n=1 Tax=Candidatus Nitrosotenuis uzonensis TaxID=1407055 RepID=V6AVM5_9ARCH